MPQKSAALCQSVMNCPLVSCSESNPSAEGKSTSVPLTRLLLKCQAQQLVFFAALIADGKMLLDRFESFGDRLADKVIFGEFPDLHQAGIAVDFDRLRSTHDIQHFLKFWAR